MRCLYPRTVGFLADGKTISWSQKNYSKEYATFQLPCSKCIECRLEYARQWAVRCVHEASTHDENSFITLTYSDEHLKSDKLQYPDFQQFMKRLRFSHQNNQIGMFVTGEYGELKKRPHWHALIFGWRPRDLTYKYSNERGDKIYSSESLDTLWGYGISEVGNVTFESAGYCARYAAKKLVHGNDKDHDFHPISKKSSKNAIGKRFLELYWQDIFNHGDVILKDGTKTSIPRYYVKWLQKHQPAAWERYIIKIREEKIQKAQQRSNEEKEEQARINYLRGPLKGGQITRQKVRKTIIDEKFKRLTKFLKGDI